MVRRHVIVRGRVQGVWFRGATREEAVAAGVSGWVRNLPDGSVEALFVGPEAAVERMLAFCRRGPRGARVCAVEQVPDEVPSGEAEPLGAGFEIRP